jgi:hypothetical protein
MKKLKYLLLLCTVCTLTVMGINEASAKRRQLSHIYMFGFSASFSDSIIYFTDIQTVDSAWIDDKTLFLQGRDIYSQQLKDYFAASMQPNRICVVMYAPTLKEAEKKYLKMRRIYTRKSDTPYDVRYLTTNDFAFKPIQLYFEDE